MGRGPRADCNQSFFIIILSYTWARRLGSLSILSSFIFFCVVAVETLMCLYFMRPMCYFSNHPADISCDPGEKIEENIDISISAGRNFVSEEKTRLRPWTIRCMFVGAEENSLNYWAIRVKAGKKLSSRGDRVRSRVENTTWARFASHFGWGRFTKFCHMRGIVETWQSES